ncbi:hypothetical protein HMSSN139_32810 [Paenibacillus sp. HMSSN-139]|nr:hypothetical protein HMSSN139_32810 [Paenibacillus sp. HMSSN-139]
MQEPSLSYVPIGEEIIDLAVPPNHPLTTTPGVQERGVELAQLQDEPFIVLKKARASAS